MHNLDVWEMTLRKEHALHRRWAERDSRIQQALAEHPDRAACSDRVEAPRRALRVASCTLRDRWTWLAQRWLNRGPRVTTNALVMEVSGGR